MASIHTLVAPASQYFRKRRMDQMSELLNVTADVSVIDVGGYADNWEMIAAKPNILLVNIEDENWERGRFQKVKGDGRALTFPDNSFDLAYSNSVIEHVGSWEDQQAFANEIRRVGRQYYVQTPYRHFPVEAHLLTPLVQYLPKTLAKKTLRWITVHGWVTRPSQAWIDDFVDQTRLLTKREMRQLFPDATHIYERVFGMTKSIIAVRRA